MSVSWNDALGFLGAGDFQQAAASLDRARQDYEQQGNQFLAAALEATQKLCLMCLECSTASYYHQQALITMSDQLDKLAAALFDILDLLQTMETRQEMKPLRAPAAQHESRAAQQSLWQRLYSIMARERVIAHPVSLGAIKPLPLLTSPVTNQSSAALAVCLLGPFRAYQYDQPVKEWFSRKGKSIFKYLVTHRDRPISKEVLMELLWPDSPPDAARNNLNVAIYGLRQALHQNASEESHILYQDDCYLLNPELSIWVDVEEFTAQVARARQYEDNGELAAAMHEYHMAEALYNGDYLEDDRYEDWSSGPRQQLQDSYLSLLERLCHHYYEQGEYAACIVECQKVLAVDSCRENAHRWIMQCYAEQGQRYLAIRQYQDCVEALQSELDVEPSADTTHLYERIVDGEHSGVPIGASLALQF